MITTTTRTAATLSDARRRLTNGWLEARHRRLQRQGLREMLHLDDHLLRDIGVHRGDVEYAARRPHAEDPGLTLWRLSSRNRSAG